MEDGVKLERTLHTAFGDHRVRSSREFFRLDPYRAKVIIELLATEDVTPREDLFEDAESAEAVEKATRSRGRYNFIENGIPVGATWNTPQTQPSRVRWQMRATFFSTAS